MSLSDFLRDYLGLTGTKVMCRQGGCGICTVTVERLDARTGQTKSYAVNSVSCGKLDIGSIDV